MKIIIDEKLNNLTIKDVFLDIFKFSENIISLLKKDNNIKVGGEPQTVRYILKEGETLCLNFEDEDDENLIATYGKLNIIYEDENILIVDKPPYLPCHPSKLNNDRTLGNYLKFYFNSQNTPFVLRIITRLDKNTSGLVLVAKNKYSAFLLNDSMQKGEIKKEYLCLVSGKMEKKKDTINLPILRENPLSIKRIVDENGQTAITQYEVMEEYENSSLLKIHTLTGRTHQIRVHLSHISHPILGDELYGGTMENQKRQALHMSKLVFMSPFTFREMTFISNPNFD